LFSVDPIAIAPGDISSTADELEGFLKYPDKWQAPADGLLVERSQLNSVSQHGGLADANDTGTLDTNIDDAINNTASPLELIVVDPSIHEVEELLKQVLASADIQIEILVLDTAEDGIEQITQRLASLSNVSSIHILTHGTEGSVQLGSSLLSNATLDTHTESMQQWSKSLTQSADILLYGCSFASAEDGHNFLTRLSELTNADIAASDDLTGHTKYGGDWELEQKVGDIETGLSFSSNFIDTWTSALANIAVTTFDDVVSPDANLNSVADLINNPGSDGEVSLREAPLAARNTGPTTILLSTGTYTVSI